MTSIQSMFPLEAMVTKEILEVARSSDPVNCPGALTLRHALGDWANGREVWWGAMRGLVDGLWVTTKENVNMMSLEEPTKVTFVLRDQT